MCHRTGSLSLSEPRAQMCYSFLGNSLVPSTCLASLGTLSSIFASNTEGRAPDLSPSILIVRDRELLVSLLSRRAQGVAGRKIRSPHHVLSLQTPWSNLGSQREGTQGQAEPCSCFGVQWHTPRPSLCLSKATLCVLYWFALSSHEASLCTWPGVRVSPETSSLRSLQKDGLADIHL